MPASLQQTFLEHRECAQRIGWPVPPVWNPLPGRNYQIAWLEYWGALDKRAARAAVADRVNSCCL